MDSMMTLPTGTVTFLFTDIEGSTRLWEGQPEAMRLALARHDATLHAAIEAHGGVVFQSRGDGVCAAFATSPDAVAAALDAQRALSQEGEPGPCLRVRIALHSGAVELRPEGYFGQALNRVARLVAAAQGRQTLLSLAAAELVRDGLPDGCTLRDLGEHRLRDLERPEHVFQLLHPAMPADLRPLRTLENLPNNLPIHLTSFVGRGEEMRTVKQLLSGVRLLTLTGAGGCGKTRLALQVAADVLDAFPEGVWQVELGALFDGARVPHAVASAVGLREEPGRPMVDTLTENLRHTHLLLLLDNCEHLVGACAQMTEHLLRSCPEVKVLATSRAALNVPGELVWRVPSLSRPDPRRVSPDESDPGSALMQYDAVRLFVERARYRRPEFALVRSNAPLVAQVCHRLDGIPLAIELAAARIQAMGVERLAERLDASFDLLTGGGRTAPTRQQTLRATLDWSYDLLTEKERLLLRRMSVFAGRCTLDAAEAVCSDADLRRGEVLDVLTALVDKSLVAFDDQEGEDGAYGLLETIRQYGYERLAETGTLARFRSAHGDYYLGLAEEAERGLVGPDQDAWLERLEWEHDNMREALRFCLERGPDPGDEPPGRPDECQPSPLPPSQAGLRLAGALQRFWWTRGYLEEGRRWLAAALGPECAGRRTPAHAKALNGAGVLAQLQGEYDAACAYYGQSLSIRREVGDRHGVAASLSNLGNVAYDLGDYAAARAHYEESLSLRRDLGDRRGMAGSLNNLANVAQDQSDYAEALVCLEESLSIRREIGDLQGIATSLINLGRLAHEQRRYADAEASYQESLAISRRTGDRRGIAFSLGSLGRLAADQGRHAVARAYHEESLGIRRDIGDRKGVSASLHDLAVVAAHDGEPTRAGIHYRESLSIRRDLGDLAGIACSLEGLAALAAGCGRAERGACLWGAAERLREQMSGPLSATDRHSVDTAIAAARPLVVPDAWDAGWAAGRAMPLEQAIEYALGAVEGC